MLVISRRVGERVMLTIGDVRVVIQIARIDDRRAAICFDAPKEVSILREELEYRMNKKKAKNNEH